jgi:hypothetical protein
LDVAQLLAPKITLKVGFFALEHNLVVNELTFRVLRAFVFAEGFFPKVPFLLVDVLDFAVGVEPVLELDPPPSLDRHDGLDYVDCVGAAHCGLELVVELLIVEDHARGYLFDLDVVVKLCDAVDTKLNLVVVHTRSMHVLNASLLQIHAGPRADQLGCLGPLCISGLVEALDFQSAVLYDELVGIDV